MAKQSWLLIADGVSLSPAKLRALAHHRKVLVLDGAYQTARNTGLKIDVLLGDFDSIQSQDLSEVRAAGKIKVVEAPDQNKTDLEKGLDYLISQETKEVDICAAIGGRLQHTLYNLRLLKKYHSLLNLRMFTNKEIIDYKTNCTVKIQGQIGDGLAILGFPHASITSQGLQYEMQDYILDFEKTSSVSNALAQEQAWIRVEGSALLIHEPSPYPLPQAGEGRVRAPALKKKIRQEQTTKHPRKPL